MTTIVEDAEDRKTCERDKDAFPSPGVLFHEVNNGGSIYT
jgi:hypothetical protein